MMPALLGLEPQWAWLALGLFLAIGEMLIPGVFLIWLAMAAVLTGVSILVLPIGFAAQVLLFAGLALVLVFAARQWLSRHPVAGADPLMNDRGARAVGETVLVSSAIEAGSGRVRLGDSEWLARGPDAEPGTRMRVAGHDGAVLLVEHLH